MIFGYRDDDPNENNHWSRGLARLMLNALADESPRNDVKSGAIANVWFNESGIY